jgi:hypothetical protein
MRSVTVAIAFSLVASSALAQGRPLSPSMSCNQIHALLGSRGAAVIGTGRHTYDRYVASREFCEINEYLEPVWIPAADTPQCPVYRCKDDDLDFFDD